MRLHREQVTFLVALGILALVARGAFFAEDPPEPRGGGRAPELPASRPVDPDRSHPRGVKLDASARDPFAAPRDAVPLPPLVLEDPPLEPLPILAPPTVPGAAPRFYGRSQRVPFAPVEVLLGEEADLDGGMNGEPEEPAGGPAEGSAPRTGRPGQEAPEDRMRREEAYRAQYDWYRTGTAGIQWGRIVNADRFDLPARPEEALQFVPVDPERGVAFTARPIAVPRESEGRPLEFGFAETLANAVELRYRQLRFVPGSIPDLLEYADWCMENGFEVPAAFERAREVYTRVAELDPGDPEGPLGLGRLLERTFDLEGAWKHYRGMVEGAFGTRAAPYLRLGAIAEALGLHDLALQHYLEAIRHERASWEAHLAYGEFLLARGREAEAREALEHARRLEPTGPRDRARLRAALGRAALAAADLAAAERAFTDSSEAARGMKAEEEPEDPLAEALAGLAATHVAKGEFDRAIEVATTAIAETRETLPLFLARGLARARKALRGSGAEAEAPLRAALEDLEGAAGLDPLRTAPALAALAFLYEMTGNATDAAAAIEDAYVADPTDAYVLYLRGRMLRTRGDLEGAQQTLLAALEAELDLPDALVELAAVSLLRGDAAGAERYAARAAASAPEVPDFHVLRGIAAWRGGSPRRAREHFAKALELSKENGPARNGLGLCAYAEGDAQEAQRAFAEVVDRARDAAGDPHARYADEVSKRIADHIQKVEWRDDFERSELRRGWREESEGGVTSRLVAGEVRIEGTAGREGETRVFRELAARAFVSIEASLEVDPDSQAAASGLFVSAEAPGAASSANFRVDVARLRDGEVATRVLTNPRETPPWTRRPEVSWPAGAPAVLSIGRGGTPEEPRLRITLGGAVLVDEAVREFRGAAGTYRTGAFASVEGAGRRVGLSFDAVRLVFRQE